MLAIIIVLGLLFLLTVSIRDVWGAVTFALVLMTLGWVLWGEREKSKEDEPH